MYSVHVCESNTFGSGQFRLGEHTKYIIATTIRKYGGISPLNIIVP